MSLDKIAPVLKLVSQNEEILHAEIRSLKETIKELEAFSYSISHDLKSPIRIIWGYTSTLEEDYNDMLDEEGKRCLKLIKQNTKAMTDLIEGLMELSKLGKKELTKRVVDMNTIVSESLFEIEKVKPHNAKLLVYPLQAVMADATLIKQVMMNLLFNAVKYSSKVANPLIEIGSSRINEEIIFSIRDNGAGFNMDYSHNLFSVFKRLHSHDQFEGTGVGLAIAQRIIQKHGGKIWAEGKEGAGAIFYFSLPV